MGGAEGERVLGCAQMDPLSEASPYSPHQCLLYRILSHATIQSMRHVNAWHRIDRGNSPSLILLRYVQTWLPGLLQCNAKFSFHKQPSHHQPFLHLSSREDTAPWEHCNAVDACFLLRSSLLSSIFTTAITLPKSGPRPPVSRLATSTQTRWLSSP